MFYYINIKILGVIVRYMNRVFADVKNVGILYFMSPEYTKRISLPRKVMRDEGEGFAWSDIWDERDRFDDWLDANSLVEFQKFGANYNRRHYLFFDGKFLSDVVHENFPINNGAVEPWQGVYRRVVRVRYMPLEAGAGPESLKGFLKSRDYEPLQDYRLITDDFIKRAVARLEA